MDFRSSTGVIRGLQVGAHLAQTIARRQANELRPTKKARFTGLLCGTKRGIGTGLAPAYTKNIWNFSSLGSGASFPSAITASRAARAVWNVAKLVMDAMLLLSLISYAATQRRVTNSSRNFFKSSIVFIRSSFRLLLRPCRHRHRRTSGHNF